MRSQQESCCGLTFTELNGLRLIVNSALPLIAPTSFSLTSNIHPCPFQTGIKTLIWLLAVWNCSFRLSAGSKAVARTVWYSHYVNTDLYSTLTVMLTVTGLVLVWKPSHMYHLSRQCGLFLKVALIPTVAKRHKTDLLACAPCLLKASQHCLALATASLWKVFTCIE